MIDSMQIERTVKMRPNVNFKSILEEKKYALVSSERIPLTQENWLRLETLTEEQSLSYSKVEMGDTEEAVSASYFRVKKTGEATIYHPELMSLLGSNKMMNFYRKVCNNPRLYIERCQVHLFKTGDYIARHIDRDSCEDYLFSLLIGISENYTGGEVMIYTEDAVEKIKIPLHSMLFEDCGIPHEVLPVESGIRKTIAIFFVENINKVITRNKSLDIGYNH